MALSNLEQLVLTSIDEAEVISFLQGLVRIPSPSPPGDCREAAQYCAALLQKEGVAHTVVANLPERPSILATLPGRHEHPQLAFNAHIDTVPVEDIGAWKHNPFGGEIIDGIMYGRGTGDDKSSVAAQVMALVAIHRARVQLEGTLLVNPVADEEETGAHGTQWLRDTGRLHPDMLVIGEQTDNHIAIAERSTHWIQLTVHGLSAHGAMPWNGVNAIVQTAGVIKFLQHEYPLMLAARNHPYLPPSTVNIGTITGGLKTNMVPERCQVTLDRRVLPSESLESVKSELSNLLDRYSREVEPITFDLDVLYTDNTPVNTHPADPLVRIMQSAVGDATGYDQVPTGYAQTSDGRFFAGTGIPIVIFGPSHPDVGHSANERVNIAQVIEATKIYALTALRTLHAS